MKTAEVSRRIFWPIGNEYLTMVDFEVSEALADMAAFRKRMGLRKGDRLEVHTTRTDIETEMRPEYRFGYDGQKREMLVGRQETLVSVEAI